MQITLDRQVLQQPCGSCAVSFTAVRGSVFDAGKPVGLYLVALHGHSTKGRLAHLAIALVNAQGVDAVRPPSSAAAMDVVATEEQFEVSVVDWKDSPWKGEAYLGQMLDRTSVLSNDRKAVFFHVADHILEDVPEVAAYFA